MSTEQMVAQHYAQASLEQAIFDALRAVGKDPDRLTHADLAPADEFHIGGRQATIDFAAHFAPRAGMHLLDIGSGIGGASRYFAQEHGCRVTGVDLTEEFVRAAETLSRRVGLGDRLSYKQGSATALPFPDASFDGAYMLHVGMNIADKAKLCAEVRRVLKPGARFGIYDVMREGDGEFVYPVPWSAQPETNCIAAPADYRRALEAAGFALTHERSRREFALRFFQEMRERMAQSGPSPLGLQIVMGASAPQKIANMIGLLEHGVIAPVEIIARAA
jgi:ubiquinone/menaquinone biosynthesis C-methylase UbiE